MQNKREEKNLMNYFIVFLKILIFGALTIFATHKTVKLIQGKPAYKESINYFFLEEEANSPTQKLPVSIDKTQKNNIIKGYIDISNSSTLKNPAVYIPYYDGNIRIWLYEPSIINFPLTSFRKGNKDTEVITFDRRDGIVRTKTILSGSPINSILLPVKGFSKNKSKTYLRFSIHPDFSIEKNTSLLSKIYVGEYSDLKKIQDKKRLYHQVILPAFAITVYMTVILISISFFMGNRKEIFPLLCFMICVGFGYTSYLFNIFPKLIHLEPNLFFLAPVGAVSLYNYGQNLITPEKMRINRKLYLFSILFTVFAYLITLQSSYNIKIEQVLTFMIIPFFVILALFTIYRAAFITLDKSSETRRIFLIVLMILIIGSSAHDLMAQRALLEVTEAHTTVVIAGIYILLFSHFIAKLARTGEKLRNYNNSLAKELQKQSANLKIEFAAREKIQKELAIKSEFARINEDLHDGVLTYLYSIKKLSDNNDKQEFKNMAKGSNYEKIATLAQFALNELRIIFRSNLNHNSSLILVLSNFRHHVIDSFEALGIEVSWNTATLQTLGETPLKNNLEILRVIQEAIHNAVNRANCKGLSINGTLIGDNLKFEILNWGGKTLPENFKPGFGITNMQNRVNRLKGDLRLYPQLGGAVLEFNIPVSEFLKST